MMRSMLFSALTLCAVPALCAELSTVNVGAVPTIPGSPLYIAQEKGYFKEAGLDLQIKDIASSSEMAVLLATGQLHVVTGAPSVGMFNSVARNLPLKVIVSQAASPYNQSIMVRTGLKDVIKTPADLKGRTIGVNARGSITVYQLGKVLETGGLTIEDVDVKYIAFTQMVTALSSQALDAAVMISPTAELAEKKGFAIRWVNPDHIIKAQPTIISVMQINTEWARKEPEAAYKFTRALLKATREYCDAFHHGPNRAEVIKIISRSTGMEEALVNEIEWSSRDPYGRVPEASLTDIQAFFAQRKDIEKAFSYDQLVDTSFIDRAEREMGPYKPAFDDGKPGCR